MSKLRGRLRLLTQQAGARLGVKPQVYYVTPEANWIIDWVGYYITEFISKQYRVGAFLINNPKWLAGQIVHYGTLWSWLGYVDSPANRRNHVVATVFHGDRKDADGVFSPALDKLLAHQDELRYLVTASQMMVDRFVRWGVAPQRIVRIPLGVDLSVFSAPSKAQRKQKRQELGLRDDVFCIGTFQKDGVGWEEGLEPKLIKGPDIFLKVIEKLSRQYKIHVLLSAPARGYVKQGLERIGVPYTHKVFENYLDIANYYHALDAYVVPSREEGGPLGVLEALASEVPLVTTRVGLASDVIENGHNGILVDPEDVDGLGEALSQLIEVPDRRAELTRNGLKSVRAYDWKKIATEYYQKVYRPLIKSGVETGSV